MNPAVISFLIKLALNSPDLAGEGAKLYADIAHGEGGFVKVGKALSDLAGIFGSVAGVAESPAAPGAQQAPQ